MTAHAPTPESALLPLVTLIDRYLDGRLTSRDFETRYLAEFSEVPDVLAEESFEEINTLFYAVDDYVENSELRPHVADAIDEAGLRAAATEARRNLRHLHPKL